MISRQVHAGESKIADQLSSTGFAIVCVTPENQERPWLNFEAGAISKHVENRVTPYLFDIKKPDLKRPLGQFQAYEADIAGTLEMVKSINEACKGQANYSQNGCNAHLNYSGRG